MRSCFPSWQSRQMCHTRSMELMPAIEEFMTPLPVWTERGEILLPLFGAGHLAWLGEDSEKQRRFELAVALAPLLLLGIHSSSMLAWGAFTPNCLPLHICNLCEILALVYALSGERNVGDVLYGVGIVDRSPRCSSPAGAMRRHGRCPRSAGSSSTRSFSHSSR